MGLESPRVPSLEATDWIDLKRRCASPRSGIARCVEFRVSSRLAATMPHRRTSHTTAKSTGVGQYYFILRSSGSGRHPCVRLAGASGHVPSLAAAVPASRPPARGAVARAARGRAVSRAADTGTPCRAGRFPHSRGPHPGARCTPLQERVEACAADAPPRRVDGGWPPSVPVRAGTVPEQHPARPRGNGVRS